MILPAFAVVASLVILSTVIDAVWTYPGRTVRKKTTSRATALLSAIIVLAFCWLVAAAISGAFRVAYMMFGA